MASTIQKLYLTSHPGGLLNLPKYFWAKSLIHANGQIAHQILPTKMNERGRSAHQKVQVRIEAGFSE